MPLLSAGTLARKAKRLPLPASPPPKRYGGTAPWPVDIPLPPYDPVRDKETWPFRVRVMKRLNAIGLPPVTFDNNAEWVPGPELYDRIVNLVPQFSGWGAICAFDWHNDAASRKVLDALERARQGDSTHEPRAIGVVLSGAGAKKGVAKSAVARGLDVRMHHALGRRALHMSPEFHRTAPRPPLRGTSWAKQRASYWLHWIDAFFQNHAKVVILTNSKKGFDKDTTVIIFGNGITKEWSEGVGSTTGSKLDLLKGIIAPKPQRRARLDSALIVRGEVARLLAEPLLLAYGQAKPVKHGHRDPEPIRIPAETAMAEIHRFKGTLAARPVDYSTPQPGGMMAVTSVPDRTGETTQWAEAFHVLATEAREELIIVSPMVDPTEQNLQDIRGDLKVEDEPWLTEQDIEFLKDSTARSKILITNRFPLGDHNFVQAQSVLRFRELMDANVRIILTSDPLHDKKYYVDRAVVASVSANWNHRSQSNEDIESGAVCFDQQLTGQMRSYADLLMDKRMSVEVTYDMLPQMEEVARQRMFGPEALRYSPIDAIEVAIASLGS